MDITARIIEVVVKQLLVDSGAFCNILFKKTLDELGDFVNFVESGEHMVRGFRDTTVRP